MPLTSKGSEIKNAMIHEYGSKKGEEVFYASKNAGKIEGVDCATDAMPESPDDLTNITTSAPAADTRDAALVHKAFQGDMSLMAGAGKGIQSVPEYRRK